jgi:cytochrome c biogenesis protein CcmG/thiol:disulfide interchange protein DsbE
VGLVLFIGIGAALAGYGVYRNLESSESRPAEVFKAAPNFELPDAQGRKYSLKDFAGSVVILHFWASWCPPCLDEIPRWVELGRIFKDRPVKLVAISLDPVWADALKILPTAKLIPNITSLIDTEGKTPDRYGSFQFPETYLLSPDLKVVIKWVGPQDWESPEIRNLIEKALNAKNTKDQNAQ